MEHLLKNILPDENEFIIKSNKQRIIPVSKVINGDLETPISLFTKLADDKYCYLLESAESDGKWNRYSIIGRRPLFTVKTNDFKTIVEYKNRTEEHTGNPFTKVEELLRDYNSDSIEYLPRFFGGLTGYFGYETTKYVENIRFENKDEALLPEIHLMMPEEVVVYDHLKQKITLIINCVVDTQLFDITRDIASRLYKQAIERLHLLENDIINKTINYSKSVETTEIKEIRSNFKKEEFCEAVNKAKKYIYEGDIFQVVLSQKLQMDFDGDGLDVYRRLRVMNPSPYMFFLRMDEYSIVGASPEMLVRVENGMVETCPIAGTRKRGATPEEDELLAKDLKQDEKELAEHRMLVDLGRNDVGKVSEFGSVKVIDPMHIEKFSHVMHMVTNVEGVKRKDVTLTEVLLAIQPAGTVSGAPKIRAMEIIEELEPTRRGVYAGAIGYIGLDGTLDTCIAIRTAVVKNNKIYVQAGAGIVADSIPENEYEETLNKAKALIKAINSEE